MIFCQLKHTLVDKALLVEEEENIKNYLVYKMQEDLF